MRVSADWQHEAHVIARECLIADVYRLWDREEDFGPAWRSLGPVSRHIMAKAAISAELEVYKWPELVPASHFPGLVLFQLWTAAKERIRAACVERKEVRGES